MRRQSTTATPIPSTAEFLDPSVLADSSIAPAATATNTVLSLQRSVQQKDRAIDGLKLELSKTKEQIHELQGGGHRLTTKLEMDLQEARQLNEKLHEDNESYQMLLQERTMNGEFSNSDFMRSQSTLSKYGSVRGPPNGLDLAQELVSNEDVIQDASRERDGLGYFEVFLLIT